MDDLIKAVADHFNSKAQCNEVDFGMHNMGAKSLGSDYLSAPYVYVEKNFVQDLEGKVVLDYCCGTGEFSFLPALRGAKVFGMDISESSIGVAKKRAEDLGLSEQCEFQVMNAEDLSYESNFFDVIFSYGSLSYLDLKNAYSELSRVLKPNGKLVIVDSLGHNPVFNYNRRRNIMKFASGYSSELSTLKVSDFNLLKNSFSKVSLRYYDLLTLLGYLIRKKLKVTIPVLIFSVLDRMLLSMPIFRRLAFKCVCVCENKK